MWKLSGVEGASSTHFTRNDCYHKPEIPIDDNSYAIKLIHAFKVQPTFFHCRSTFSFRLGP